MDATYLSAYECEQLWVGVLAKDIETVMENVPQL